jgi:hypothetical protein
VPALSELEVPRTRSLADVAVPEAGVSTAPAQQKDVEAFHATAGGFRKGLRSAVNSLGASVQALAGGTAEAMGATEFAESRFREAAEYVDFAHAVGPRVRDYRDVRDYDDAVDFAVGLAGQAAGSALPMLGAGAAGLRFGLRGAAIAAGAGSFVPETGEALLTSRGDPGDPRAKLAVAAGKGAVNAGLDVASLAVPAGAVVKGARGAAQPVLKTAAKAVGAEAATEGLQEVVGQRAHEIINPARDASDDRAAVINATLGGAVGGGMLGGAAGGASKLASLRRGVPKDRAQTPDEAKEALGVRERPLGLDPDPESMPDDPEAMGAALDEHDAKVDARLRRAAADPKFKEFEGWEKSPTKREAFAEAVANDHKETVDKPRARRLVEGFRKFVDGLRPAPKDGVKKSQRRTAVDLAIHDEIVKRMPEELRESLTPEQRLQFADDLRDYAIHTAGRKEELPGPGEPQLAYQHTAEPGISDGERPAPTSAEGPRPARRVIPHDLMDAMGDRFFETVDVVQRTLGKGGIPLARPLAKKEAKEAEKRRGIRLSKLEDTVLGYLRPQIQGDPDTRALVVKEMTRRLQRRINEGLSEENREEFLAEMEYAFGDQADDVYQAFEAERESISRTYEDLDEPRTDEDTAKRIAEAERFAVREEDEGDGPHPVSEAEPNPTGEQDGPAERAHPYRDDLLGVPLERDKLGDAMDDLRSRFSSKEVRLTVEPQEDGRIIIRAEDADTPMGFSPEEVGRIRDAYGKAGHENNVVSYVRKGAVEGRNETAAVSLPNLTAEVLRSTPLRDDGRAAIREAVLEGLSRLASDPDFVRWAPLPKGQTRAHMDLPDDVLVYVPSKEARAAGAKEMTWGEVRRTGSWASTRAQRMTDDVVLAATREQSLLEALDEDKVDAFVDKNIKALDGAKQALAEAKQVAKDAEADLRTAKRLNKPAEWNKVKAAREALWKAKRWAGYVERSRDDLVKRLEQTREDLKKELRRREEEGDFPLADTNRERGIKETQEISERQVEDEKDDVRFWEEDSGLPIGRDPELRRLGPGRPMTRGTQQLVLGGGAYAQLDAVGKEYPHDQVRFFLTAEDGKVYLVDMKTTEWNKVREMKAEERLPHIRKNNEGFAATSRRPRGLDAPLEGKKSGEPIGEGKPEAGPDAPLARTASEDTTRRLMDEQAAKEKADKKATAAAKRKATLAAKKPKLSELRVGREPMTAEQKAEAEAEVKRLLGDEVAVEFIDDMEAAGEFAKLEGVETIRIMTMALDPKGVGYHEALHALISRLAETNPRAANALLLAARSPTVVARLRHLLRNEPAALEQLKDPEERAAYMYEFWAAGQLKVGPQAEGTFGRIKDLLKRALHAFIGVGEDVATMHQAEQLLLAFHDGALADRSAATRVLDALVPREEIQAKWVARLGDTANRVLSTADGYVREMKISAVTELADKLFNPGEGAPGLVQARHVVRHQYMNRYFTATKGLDKDAEARVLKTLQTGETHTANAAEAAAVRAIHGLMDDLFAYMVEKKVKVVEWSDEAHTYQEHDLKRVPGYFPRAYDGALLHREAGGKWNEFVAVLKRHGVKEAESVAQQLFQPTKASPDESDFTAGLTHYAPNTMSRKLNIPDAELEPFMKKDLGSIMYDYINYTTRRGEYASRFGNRGQGIADVLGRDVKGEGGAPRHIPGLAEKQGATPEQMSSLRKYVQAMEGTLGSEIDPKMRKFMGAVLTYQNFRLLPLALFSSLIDPLGIWVRGGTATEAFTAFTRGVRELVSTKQDEARELARAVGAINEATEEHMVAEMYGANYGSNWQKWMNEKLFKLNGMESWNNSMRTAASAAAREFIIRHAQRPNEHSERYLRELGLEKGDVRIDDGERLELTPVVVDAINRWVDGAVLRPHAGIRPIWMSDPHFMLVGHLKQFAYSFQKTINERVAHEALHGNYTPLLVLSSYVPAIIAADILRSMVTPGGSDDDRLQKWGLKDWLAHGISRAGITGPGAYALDSYGDLGRGKLGIEAIGGPTIEQLSGFLHAAAGNGSLAREGLRALPLAPALRLY